MKAFCNFGYFDAHHFYKSEATSYVALVDMSVVEGTRIF